MQTFRSAIAMSALPPTAVGAPHLAHLAHQTCNTQENLAYIRSLWKQETAHGALVCFPCASQFQTRSVMRLNKVTASHIEVPAGKAEVIVFDDDIPGFGVRVRA